MFEYYVPFSCLDSEVIGRVVESTGFSAKAGARWCYMVAQVDSALLDYRCGRSGTAVYIESGSLQKFLIVMRLWKIRIQF